MRATRAAGVAGLMVGALLQPIAATAADAPSREPCREVAHPARGGADIRDPDEWTAARMRAADALLTEAEAGLSAVSKSRGHQQVRVFVHVLRTSSSGGVTRKRIEQQLRVMNGAYAGRQSAHSATTPFHFVLAGISVTTNAAWNQMNEGTRAERRAKRTLHRGDGQDLNLYIGSNTTDVLGWATQPTELATQPFMDGVVIARHTMPGGAGGHYGAGDAAVHEIGHWLGLFHTFAGRCGKRGDLVADTAPEARPSYTCPVKRDTCRAPGNDPVHNFMDYSYDSCMNVFTQGQVDRMTRSWTALRAGGRLDDGRKG